MALTIVPRQENWGSLLGQGVGEGLASGIQALAQGKISQMNKRAFASRLKESGENPAIAYYPKEFGVAALKHTQTQRANEANRFREISEAANAFNAKVQTARRLGIDEDEIKYSAQEGPVRGLQSLSAKIKNLEKPELPLTWGQWFKGEPATGTSPYKRKSNTPLLDEEVRKENPQAAYFQDILQAIEPTQAQKQQEKQDRYNQQLQQEQRQNPPKNKLDVINDAAAQKVMQENQPEVQPELDPKLQQYQQVLSNPNVALERKKEIYHEMQDYLGSQEGSANAGQLASSFGIGVGKGALSISPAFLPQTLISGALGLGNMITEGLAGKKYLPAYEELREINKEAKAQIPEAVEKGKNAGVLHRLGAAALEETAKQPTGIVPTANEVVEAGKELTRGTPLEKYAIPKSKLQHTAENLGELAAFGYKGGPTKTAKALGVTGALAKAVGSETAGWLTEKYTGSEKAGNAVRMATFVGMNLFPGTFQGLAKQKYNIFDKEVIKPAETAGEKINFKKYIPEWQNIKKKIKQHHKSTPERGALETMSNKIEALFEKNDLADPQEVFNMKKSLSKLYNKVPAGAHGIYQEGINLLNEQLTDLGKKVNPQYANTLEEGNQLYREMYQNQGIKKFIISHIPSRNLGLGALLLFAKAGWPALIGSAGSYYLGSTLLQALKNPAMRSAMMNVAKAGAAKNAAAVAKYSKNLDQEFEKNYPDLYNYFETLKNK